MKKLITLLVTISITLYVVAAQVGPHPKTWGITATWDPSPTPGVTNYAVYYGVSSGIYSNFVLSGGTNLNYYGTNISLTISNLSQNTIYYVAVTALAANGDESVYSNELFTNTPPRTLPPRGNRLFSVPQ